MFQAVIDVDQRARLSQHYTSYNARLHLIFANGTEMNMLFQSLIHGLVRDEQGYKVIREGVPLTPDDTPVPTGLVYVLATKSTDAALAEYKSNLYKVGFTDGTVEDRIKYAEKDRTFLEAAVRLVMTTECYNIDAHKLETLIHSFLGHRRLNITLKGHTGQTYNPKEWFHVPLNTVLEVINIFLMERSLCIGWTIRQVGLLKSTIEDLKNRETESD